MKGCLKVLLVMTALAAIAIVLALQGLGSLATASPTPAPGSPEAIHGAPPVAYGTTLPSAVVRALKQQLKDPDSLQVVQIVPPRTGDWQGEPCWVVEFSYRAKNSLGGYAQPELATAYLRGSTLLALRPGRAVTAGSVTQAQRLGLGGGPIAPQPTPPNPSREIQQGWGWKK